MSLSNTNSGSGWQCPSCKTWIPAGEFHACNGFMSFEEWFAGWFERHMKEVADFHKRAMWDAWQAKEATRKEGK